MRVLRNMLALLALAAGVWLIHLFGRVLPDVAAGAVWAAVAVLIAAGRFHRARIRRSAFLAAYVRSGSRIARWLRGGWLMAAGQLVLAACLALVLIVALIRLDERAVWVVLIASVPLVVLAQRLLERSLAASVNAAYLPELSWRLTVWGAGVLLLGGLVLLAFQRPYPDLGDVSLERAVWHYVDQEHARALAVQSLLELAAAKDALRLWLAQQLMPEPGVSLAQALGWMIVLAEEAVFVWSYLELCIAVLIGFHENDRSRSATP